MADIYKDMWVNPFSVSAVGQAKRDYVRDMSRKENETAFFDKYSMGGTGYNGMTDAVNATAHAEQAKVAAAESAAASDKAKAIHKKQMLASLKTQKEATTQARSDLNPWRQAGVDALGKLTEKVFAGPGDYTESPGYQFRLDEGQKSLERTAAAKGNVMSGAAVKAATRYGQDFATNDYDNFLRRYYESLQPLERMSDQGRVTAGAMSDVSMRGAAEESQTRRAGATGMATAEHYKGDATAGGTMNAANIMAIQQQATAERDYGYDAWKKGEEF